MTRPAAGRIFGQSYDPHHTDHDHGIIHYTAPCATCQRLAEYTAKPGEPLRVWCPTCEAKP